MRRLVAKLTMDGEWSPDLPFGEVHSRKMVNAITMLLVPVLVFAGIFSVSGRHLIAFEYGSKKQLDGISYSTNFSDVFYASDQMYTAYERQKSDYHLAIRLPDLSDGRRPKELRGIANITWQVNEEIRTSHRNSTQIDV